MSIKLAEHNNMNEHKLIIHESIRMPCLACDEIVQHIATCTFRAAYSEL